MPTDIEARRQRVVGAEIVSPGAHLSPRQSTLRPEREKKPRFGGIHCLLHQAELFYSWRLGESILSPALTAVEVATPQVEMLRG